MQAVILAAGMGMRLRPAITDIPKGMIEIGEKTLLRRSIDFICACGFVKEIIIVTGYKKDIIKNTFGEKHHDIPIFYVDNQRYFETGNIFSLYLAKNIINDSFLLFESDLLYEPKAIDILAKSQFNDVILVSKLLNSGDDVYVCANKKYEVTYIGKQFPDKENILGALVGISKLSKPFMIKMFKEAEKDFASGIETKFYENYLVKMPEYNVYAEFEKDLIWTEIDTETDLNKARSMIF